MVPSREQLLEALSDVIDPEVGLDVVSLGLVYDVRVEGGHVQVDLTMTTPACPLGDLLTEQAVAALEEVPGVERAEVHIVWSPPWTPERMSPEARETLGW